jgi:EmrB/QacA subfamily drug resistance transporter
MYAMARVGTMATARPIAPTATPAVPWRHLFAVLAGMAVLMAAIDSTIMAVALPNLTTALDAPLAWAGWTLTAYQLVQMIMLPLAGKLSDSFGRQRVFVFCVATFTISSALCGLAPNVGLLILFRALQAIGGGGLAPSAYGIIADQYKERRAQALGLYTSVFPMGGIIGPTLGGFILANWSWRELFWINVPIGLVVLLGVWRLLPAGVGESERRPLKVDVVGLLTYATAIVALVYGMTLVAEDTHQATSPLVWGLVALSVLLVVLFVRHIRRSPDPVMDYKLVGRNPFFAANLYSFTQGAAIFGFFSFIPSYAIWGYGLDVFQSGAVMFPRALVMLAASTLAGISIVRTGYRMPMVVGMAVLSGALFLLSRHWTTLPLGPWTLSGFWLLAIFLAFTGFALGFSNPASSNAAVDLAPHQAAALSGIRSMFNMTGGVISLSAVNVLLSFYADKGAGLATVYGLLAGVVLLTIPFALMIPDTAKQHQQRPSVPTFAD